MKFIVLGHMNCLVQTKLNKRRRKRRGKKEKTPTLDTFERVYTVLKTGQLADYTHPREVDPWWSKLYIQYEYLTYLLIALDKEIEKEKAKENPDNAYIESLEEDKQVLRKKRKVIFDYMYNFMIIIYGAVLKNRFYGWKKYTEEFVSVFTEHVLDSIRRLNFDPDKSRPSIYYYQLFWLSGIGLTKKIRNRLNKTVNDEYHSSNKGSLLFSYNDDLDEEELYNRALNELYEEDYQIESQLDDDKVSEIFDEETEASDVIKLETTNEDELVIHSDIDEENNDNEELTLSDVLRYILIKAKINPDIIYKETTKKGLTEIGQFVKKLLISGKIKLPEEHLKILEKHGLSLPKRKRRSKVGSKN